MSMDFKAFLFSLVLFPLGFFLIFSAILLGISFAAWHWPFEDTYKAILEIIRVSCVFGWTLSLTVMIFRGEFTK